MTARERADRTERADADCRSAYAAAGGPPTGSALIAVGGYGRGELAPYSDLDVVLVSEDGAELGELAAQLWYPLWDAGHKVDHSVRSFSEMMSAARADVRVGLGLLDLRHLAGDTHLTLRLRAALVADWRRNVRERLVQVQTVTERRHATMGELGHLSVPDLKEAAGGLRDACVLRALAATWAVEVPQADLERCRRELLDVRDHVHALSGRAVDRVQPELWEPLAEALGLPGAEAAQRHVRGHARRLAHLTRLTWQRVVRVLADEPQAGPEPSVGRGPERVGRGLAVIDGEVTLDPYADVAFAPEKDPTLLLRAAAVAAERDIVLAPEVAALVATAAPPLPVPWPTEARQALVRMLSGPGLLAVWETLEETGALETFLPEWDQIRLLPHASVVHRFTVDRHVVETCVEAARLAGRVKRPDLLVVTALLHDIGKGSGLDHSIAGEGTARAVAARMGFTAEECETIATLVRWHLLLPSVATGRDLEDPVTVEEVTTRIRTQADLDLLAALTEADARAASAKAWSTWRARLVAELVARARKVLGESGAGPGEVAAAAPAAAMPDSVSAEDERVVIPLALRSGNHAAAFQVETLSSGCRVRVVARDRVGLLADVAATLGLQRVSVRAAHAWAQSEADGTEWALSRWEVDAEMLDSERLRTALELVARGDADLRRLERASGSAESPVVLVRPQASRSATVLEVRAPDRPGLLHQVLSVVADLDMTVRSAHVDTVGPQAVDVFYVCEFGAGALSESRAAEAAHAIRAVLTPTG